MKIVHFSAWENYKAVGGTEYFILDLCKGQIALGNDITIVCPNLIDDEEELFFNGVRHYLFAAPNPNGNLKISSGKVPSLNIHLWRDWLIKNEVEVLHVHVFEPYVIWYLDVAILLGIQIFVTPHVAHFTCATGELVHGGLKCTGEIDILKCSRCFTKRKIVNNELNNSKFIEFFYFINTLKKINLKRNQIKRLSKIVSKFIVLTNDYKNILINNSISPEHIAVLKYSTSMVQNTCYLDVSQLIFSFVGRLTKEKGFFILLEALMLVSSSRRIIVKFYGANVDVGDLETIKGHLFRKNIEIELMGVVDPSNLKIELAESHAIFMPSTVYEMSPLVIQEAFCLGIPVIGSNIGGIQEYIIHGKNGLLFEIGNIFQLSKIIEDISLNPDLLIPLRKNIMFSDGVYGLSGTVLRFYKNN